MGRRNRRDAGGVATVNQGQAEGREVKLERQEETWRKIRPEITRGK